MILIVLLAKFSFLETWQAFLEYRLRHLKPLLFLSFFFLFKHSYLQSLMNGGKI